MKKSKLSERKREYFLISHLNWLKNVLITRYHSALTKTDFLINLFKNEKLSSSID